MKYLQNWVAALAGWCALALLLGWLSPADAQNAMCGKRTELTAELAKRFNEEAIGMGLSDNGALFELFASADGKTFTMMVSKPNGLSCFVGAGVGWEELKPVPKGSGT